MPDLSSSANISTRPLLSTRAIVQVAMLPFAFLLPFITWLEAAGCAALMLLFSAFVLSHLDLDAHQQPGDVIATSSRSEMVFYPISIFILILLYRNNLHVVAAAWAIFALGDGAASIAGQTFRSPSLPWNRTKTWAGLVGFITAGTVGAYALARWVNPALPWDKVLMISFAASVVGALVETLPIRLDNSISVALVTGAFLFCVYLMNSSSLASNWPYLGRRLVLGVAINAAFALAAFSLKIIDRWGAIAGFFLGVAVYLGYGYKSFLVLLSFVVLGFAATRLGYRAKSARGLAEARGGKRTWREVTANTLAGAFFSILVITTPHEAVFLVALVAAFAEAAGDTVSSEIGKWISPRAYLITNFKSVPAGENGGVSLGGSLAGLIASALVVALGYGLGLCGARGALIACAAAVAGNLFDSVLGATVERRGLVTNGIVNFAGTSFAGGLALALAFRFHL